MPDQARATDVTPIDPRHATIHVAVELVEHAQLSSATTDS